MRLFEIESNFDPSYYLSEGCGIFAYILSKILGKGRIVLLSDPDGEKWSKSIPYEVTHAALLVDGKLYDVRGQRTVQDMIDTDFPQGIRWRNDFEPEQFKRKFMGSSDSKPLFGPTKQD